MCPNYSPNPNLSPSLALTPALALTYLTRCVPHRARATWTTARTRSLTLTQTLSLRLTQTQTQTLTVSLTLALALTRREREALQLACPGGEQEQGVEDHAHPAEGPPGLLRAERHHRRGRLSMNEVGDSQERAGSRTVTPRFAFPASFLQQGISSGLSHEAHVMSQS